MQRNVRLQQSTAAEREEILQRRRETRTAEAETRTAEAETRTAEVRTLQDGSCCSTFLSVDDANVVAVMIKFHVRLSQIYSYAWPAV